MPENTPAHQPDDPGLEPGDSYSIERRLNQAEARLASLSASNAHQNEMLRQIMSRQERVETKIDDNSVRSTAEHNEIRNRLESFKASFDDRLDTIVAALSTDKGRRDGVKETKDSAWNKTGVIAGVIGAVVAILAAANWSAIEHLLWP